MELIIFAIPMLAESFLRLMAETLNLLISDIIDAWVVICTVFVPVGVYIMKKGQPKRVLYAFFAGVITLVTITFDLMVWCMGYGYVAYFLLMTYCVLKKSACLQNTFFTLISYFFCVSSFCMSLKLIYGYIDGMYWDYQKLCLGIFVTVVVFTDFMKFTFCTIYNRIKKQQKIAIGNAIVTSLIYVSGIVLSFVIFNVKGVETYIKFSLVNIAVIAVVGFSVFVARCAIHRYKLKKSESK